MQQYILPAQGDTAHYLESLEIAIVREIKARYIYKTIAKYSRHPELTRKLEFLADEEFQHRNNIEDLYNKISGKLKNFDSIVVLPDESSVKAAAGLEKTELLKMAIGKEIEAHDLYITLASQNEDTSISEMFKYLAEEEVTHRRILELELKLFTGQKPIGAERSLETIPGVYKEWW
jgi:rubrerythrin